jgi:hypothetical protein
VRVAWDKTGKRFFQTGTDRGVLYSLVEDEYSNGVAWNGLISVRVGPTGSTAYDGKLYRRSVKFGVEQSFNEYNGKITCFTYPDEFEPCIGYVELIPGMYVSQQNRPLFGLSFRTLIGNDMEGTECGYRIHLVYNCLVTTNDGKTETLGDETKAEELMYDLETFPVETELMENPSSEVVFDSRKLTQEQLTTLEDILYGTEESEPRLPYPDELVEILREAGGLDTRLYPEPDLQPDEELYPLN